jgi:hypothetical protein
MENMEIEIIEDNQGNESVFIIKEDGSTLSMSKQLWEKVNHESI